MKILKSFKLFKEELETKTAPSKPEREVIVEPDRKVSKPTRPSPIRRSAPGVSPAPKAGKPKEGTIEGVLERFSKITNQK